MDKYIIRAPRQCRAERSPPIMRNSIIRGDLRKPGKKMRE